MSARVTNIGTRAGDDVVELYLTHPGVEAAPIRALEVFQRIHLELGASRIVTFTLHSRDLSVVDASGVRRIVPGEVRAWIGGGLPFAGPGQPATAGVETGFRITSAAILPE